MPKPVIVSIDVPQPPEVVFDYLDAMRNHAEFNGHLMSEWEFSGPERGVGARATAKVDTRGFHDTIEFEVIEAERPRRSVERNRLRRLGRVGQGTYTLAPPDEGGTHVEFEYVWIETPFIERLTSAFSRSTLRKANAEALRRLAERLATEPGEGLDLGDDFGADLTDLDRADPDVPRGDPAARPVVDARDRDLPGFGE